jgi:S1-C subfamily serine protease
MEEHGLEVVSVDPSSGAARAGLHGQARATALGIAGGIGGLLLGPLELMVLPLLERSGALGTGGDLVLAVDDIRVRDVNEFRKAMRALKPGDSVYLTVIRPLRGGGHQTMRIRVELDSCSNADVVRGPIWQNDQIPPHSRSLN